MSDDRKRHVIRNTRVWDKTRPEGQQEVAMLYAHGDRIFFACEFAVVKESPDDEGQKVCFLGKQHAIEFASCLLMMALGLPGDVPAGDVSFDPDQFGLADEEAK